jgi:MFS family permease
MGLQSARTANDRMTSPDTSNSERPTSLGDAAPTSLPRHRPFAFYWLSRVASTVALQMQSVAIAWQMYEITNNPLDLGLVGLVHFFAAASLVLVAGHVADRYDRRTVVRCCQFVAGLAAATLAAGTAAGWLSRESILAIVLVIGAARTFEQTTQTTLLPAVVPLPMLARATAASASATQLAVIAGPALGGLIYAISPILVYALCCALYISAGLVVGLIRIRPTTTTREPFSFAVLFAGFGYIRRNKIILGAISLDLFAVVLGGVFALLPVFARDVLGTGPWGLGLLRASPGLGALLIALTLTNWSPRQHVGRIIFGAVATGERGEFAVRQRVEPTRGVPRRADGGVARRRAGRDRRRDRRPAGGADRHQGVFRTLPGRHPGHGAALRPAAVGSGDGRLHQPTIEEIGQPGAARAVVDQPALEMAVARLGVRHLHAVVAARGPAAHHGVRDVHVELQRIARAAAKRLHRE